MNKKNIILILVGILIISMRFNVTFGHINIDVTNDCVGFLLIIIGVLPMINRNSRFKKSGIVAIVGFIASVIAQIINFIDWQDREFIRCRRLRLYIWTARAFTA